MYGQDGHSTGSVNSGIFAEGMVSVKILEFAVSIRIKLSSRCATYELKDIDSLFNMR